VDFGTTELGDFVTKTITVHNTGGSQLDLGSVQVIGPDFNLASPPASTSLPPQATTTFDVKFAARHYGTLTGSVSIASNDFDENPFNFSLTGTVAPFQPQIIDDGDRPPDYNPGNFIPGPKREGFGGDVDYQLANRAGAATWTFSGLEAGTYQLAATWSPAYNRATNARYRIDSGPNIPVNQRSHPRDFMANGARWEVLGQASVAGLGSITVSLRAGTNGIAIADAVRLVRVSDRVLYRPGELAVVDNGDPGFVGSSNGVSIWETVGRTSFDGEYAYLKGDNNGNATSWTFTGAPGFYRVAVAYQWAPYNRATDVEYTINGVPLPNPVSQKIPPSADQLGQGVVNVNGTDFQVLSSSVEIPADSDTIQVRVTDDANSYVSLDAVMVELVTVTPVPPPPPPFPLAAAAGAAVPPEEAEAVTAEELGPLVVEAITRWSDTGLDEAGVEEVQSAEVIIADLPGATLGLASESSDAIWIDVDAAGHGWFVDPTPAWTVGSSPISTTFSTRA
jgi:hypothetical protein